MVEIILEIKQPPEVPGFNDTLLVCVDNHLVYACPAAGGPNHRQPIRFGGGRWQEKYGCVAPGEYFFHCMDHYKYGKSILINNGDEVTSRVPNPNQGGEYYLTEIFIHQSSDMDWRGSAGCPTIQPLFWDGFLYFFNTGDRGKFNVIDV